MKNTIIFVIFVLLVLGLLTLFSGTRAPRIPEDSRHAALSDNAACMECHGPGKVAERKKTHPPKDECLLCHKVKRKVRTP
ncbi:MAG TPA: hypothetical protein VFG09_02620 [Thermodesulfovibrionales bacterium]|jgi:hypothetical protein|nr:hypothetical protein [Thermodesulfovibrionales bacterium]